MSCPTPHISAAFGDFAKTVLMPGDPLRSKFIAENYLSNVRLVNNVRGVQGYTGSFKGAPVSVMASGMGMPSMGIYSYELFNFYGVESIIRIGSCGALREDVKIRDIVLAQAACTNSAFANQYNVKGTVAPVCDFGLLHKAYDVCKRQGVRCMVGSLFTTDVFYNDEDGVNAAYAKMGALAVEMETAALYLTAARAKKRALAICTVSDNVVTGEATTADEREKSFTQMIEIALAAAVEI